MMEETQGTQVVSALRGVIDPELGLDIVSLGLIYKIRVDDDDSVHVLMTLTVPGCPMHESITADVERAVRSIPWVSNVEIRLTFEPAWNPERLSPEARAALGR